MLLSNILSNSKLITANYINKLPCGSISALTESGLSAFGFSLILRTGLKQAKLNAVASCIAALARIAITPLFPSNGLNPQTIQGLELLKTAIAISLSCALLIYGINCPITWTNYLAGLIFQLGAEYILSPYNPINARPISLFI